MIPRCLKYHQEKKAKGQYVTVKYLYFYFKCIFTSVYIAQGQIHAYKYVIPISIDVPGQVFKLKKYIYINTVLLKE